MTLSTFLTSIGLFLLSKAAETKDIVLIYLSATAFSIVSILPAVAFVVYLLWWIKLGRTGGYQIVNLKK